MTFVLFAVPIIFIVILIIFATVILSDSNKYKKHLNNASQIELDKAREFALRTMEEIKKIRSEYDAQKSLNEQNLPNTNREPKKEFASIKGKTLQQQRTLNKYEEYYNEKHHGTKNILSEPINNDWLSKEVYSKKLVLSKENIVRGLIAKEYLNRKNIRKRV
ncbi:crotonobetainyl-CoA--carnitine CoA-transferase [Gemella bergeri]